MHLKIAEKDGVGDIPGSHEEEIGVTGDVERWVSELISKTMFTFVI